MRNVLQCPPLSVASAQLAALAVESTIAARPRAMCRRPERMIARAATVEVCLAVTARDRSPAISAMVDSRSPAVTAEISRALSRGACEARLAEHRSDWLLLTQECARGIAGVVEGAVCTAWGRKGR
jgi:hypothetical protein